MCITIAAFAPSRKLLVAIRLRQARKGVESVPLLGWRAQRRSYGGALSRPPGSDLSAEQDVSPAQEGPRSCNPEDVYTSPSTSSDASSSVLEMGNKRSRQFPPPRFGHAFGAVTPATSDVVLQHRWQQERSAAACCLTWLASPLSSMLDALARRSARNMTQVGSTRRWNSPAGGGVRRRPRRQVPRLQEFYKKTLQITRILEQNSLAQHWARDWLALALTQVHHGSRLISNQPPAGPPATSKPEYRSLS